MISKATTVDQYITELPEDRVEPIKHLRKIFKKHLPKGFSECMGYGMIGYVVPHKLYPAGYHCSPQLPLPFLSLASQKNAITIYHMGLYGSSKLLAWFEAAHAKASAKKLDMGKSCIRYKKAEDIPYELIAELATKLTPQDWISQYESLYLKSKK